MHVKSLLKWIAKRVRDYWVWMSEARLSQPHGRMRSGRVVEDRLMELGARMDELPVDIRMHGKVCAVLFPVYVLSVMMHTSSSRLMCEPYRATLMLL